MGQVALIWHFALVALVLASAAHAETDNDTIVRPTAKPRFQIVDGDTVKFGPQLVRLIRTVTPITPVSEGSSTNSALTSAVKLLTLAVTPARQLAEAAHAGSDDRGPVGHIHRRRLAAVGHALDDPLKDVGLSRTDIANPDGRISYASYMGLIERGALLLGEPAYGLKLGSWHGAAISPSTTWQTPICGSTRSLLRWAIRRRAH